MFGKACCSHVFPCATSVVGLAGFIVSHSAGRQLAPHGWVCQRAWDGGAWSAALLPNKPQVMTLLATCGFIRNMWIE